MAPLKKTPPPALKPGETEVTRMVFKSQDLEARNKAAALVHLLAIQALLARSNSK